MLPSWALLISFINNNNEDQTDLDVKALPRQLWLWRDEEVGPIYEASGLAGKHEASCLDADLSPNLCSAVILGAVGTEPRQKQRRGFERWGVQGLARLWLWQSSALSPPPPLPAEALTAFVGVAVLSCALVQGLLLSVMVFIGFPVPARTGADPPLERSPSEDLAAGRGEQLVTCCCLGSASWLSPAPCGPAQKADQQNAFPPLHGNGLLAPEVWSTGSPSAAASWGKRSSWGRGRLQLLEERPTLGWVPSPSVPALGRAGATMSPSPGGAPCGEGSFLRDPSSPPATHSLVSRVMMMRMGLLFIPPTQLLLHMKLYRMVVNSVPTCPEGKAGAEHGGMGGRGRPGPPRPQHWAGTLAG